MSVFAGSGRLKSVKNGMHGTGVPGDWAEVEAPWLEKRSEIIAAFKLCSYFMLDVPLSARTPKPSTITFIFEKWSDHGLITREMCNAKLDLPLVQAFKNKCITCLIPSYKQKISGAQKVRRDKEMYR